MKWITTGFMKIWSVLSCSPASSRLPKMILRLEAPSKFPSRWLQLCHTAARSRKRGARLGADRWRDMAVCTISVRGKALSYSIWFLWSRWLVFHPLPGLVGGLFLPAEAADDQQTFQPLLQIHPQGAVGLLNSLMEAFQNLAEGIGQNEHTCAAGHQNIQKSQ